MRSSSQGSHRRGIRYCCYLPWFFWNTGHIRGLTTTSTKTSLLSLHPHRHPLVWIGRRSLPFVTTTTTSSRPGKHHFFMSSSKSPITSTPNLPNETTLSLGQADIGQLAPPTEPGDNDEEHAVEDPPSTATSSRSSWRSLLEVSMARSRHIRGSNYVQLATVDRVASSGGTDPESPCSPYEPRCRTVVFRGFLPHIPPNHPLANSCDDDDDDRHQESRNSRSCLLRMVTDARSDKVRQAQQHDPTVAEVVWWFPKTSEQYRIRGRLILVGPTLADPLLTVARQEAWGNLSDSARESFLDERIPGQPHLDQAESITPPPPAGGRDAQGKVVPPPDHFLLMLLSPYHVDYLRLTNMYRQVDRRVDGQWLAPERVNP